MQETPLSLGTSSVLLGGTNSKEAVSGSLKLSPFKTVSTKPAPCSVRWEHLHCQFSIPSTPHLVWQQVFASVQLSFEEMFFNSNTELPRTPLFLSALSCGSKGTALHHRRVVVALASVLVRLIKHVRCEMYQKGLWPWGRRKAASDLLCESSSRPFLLSGPLKATVLRSPVQQSSEVQARFWGCPRGGWISRVTRPLHYTAFLPTGLACLSL